MIRIDLTHSYPDKIAAVPLAASANLSLIYPYSAPAVCAFQAVAGSPSAGLEKTGMATDHRIGEFCEGVGTCGMGGVLGGFEVSRSL
jgi:hypothetical protein